MKNPTQMMKKQKEGVSNDPADYDVSCEPYHFYMWNYSLNNVCRRWNTAAAFIEQNKKGESPISLNTARKMFRSGPEGTI